MSTSSGTDVSDKVKFCFNVPASLEGFLGREEELDEIHKFSIQQIAAANRNEAAYLAAIVGPSGVGKTTLLTQYVWKYLGEFYDTAVWIDGQSDASIHASFEGLAQAMNKGATAVDFIRVLQEIYESFCQAKTILIFDNVTDYGDIRGYVPRTISNLTQPFILVASRNSPKNNIWAKLIELAPFNARDASNYFKIGLSLSTEAELLCAANISDCLLNLPLALRLALMYVKTSNSSKKGSPVLKEMKAYLRMLESNHFRHLSFEDLRFKTRLDMYERAVGTACKISTEKLKERGSLAHRILGIISYLSSDNISNISVDLLAGVNMRQKEVLVGIFRDFKGTLNKSLGIETGLEMLSDYGIIGRNAKQNLIHVHPLIQKVTRGNLEKKFKFGAMSDAIRLIQPLLRTGEYDCLRHAIHLAKCIQESEFINPEPYWSFLGQVPSNPPNSGRDKTWNAFHQLLQSGKFDEALELYHRLADDTVIASQNYMQNLKFQTLEIVFAEIHKVVQSQAESNVPTTANVNRLCEILQIVASQLDAISKTSYAEKLREKADYFLSTCKTETNSSVKKELAYTAYLFYKILFRTEEGGFKNTCYLCFSSAQCLLIAEKYDEIPTLMASFQRVSVDFLDFNDVDLDSLLTYIDLLDDLRSRTKTIIANEKMELILALKTQYQLIFDKYKHNFNYLAALCVGRGMMDCITLTTDDSPLDLVNQIKEFRNLFLKLSENCNIAASTELELRLSQIPDWIVANGIQRPIRGDIRVWLLEQAFHIYRTIFNIAVGSAAQLFEITKKLLECSLALGKKEEILIASRKLKSWLGCQGPTFRLGHILPVFAEFFAHFLKFCGSEAALALVMDLERIVKERFGRFNAETFRQMAYLSDILKMTSIGLRTTIENEALVHETLSISHRWHQIVTPVRGEGDYITCTFLHNITIAEFLLGRDEAKLKANADVIFKNMVNSGKVSGLLVLCKLAVEMKHLEYGDVSLRYMAAVKNKLELLLEHTPDEEVCAGVILRLVDPQAINAKDTAELELRILKTILP